MGHLSKAGVLTVRLVQIPRSILREGFELKDYKTPQDVTVGKKETVAFDSSNVEKNESLKGTRNFPLEILHRVSFLLREPHSQTRHLWPPIPPIAASYLRRQHHAHDLQ